MVPKTTEDRVSDNETAIAVIKQSCADCRSDMKDRQKRAEDSYKTLEGRFYYILISIIGLGIVVFANVVIALVKK